jgi:hypothetical protein
MFVEAYYFKGKASPKMPTHHFPKKKLEFEVCGVL